ncbi:MAG TPA: hypothetical protein VFN64_03385 [Burkholderiaceae bacterium]|nr:hypothetical protein [Burkholderiaceae bacterium]
MVNQLRSLVRNLFRIRRQRAVPPARGKPGVGARIAFGDYRIIVQAGMTDSLWIWLAQHGWREVTYRPDRRRYLEIPHAFVTELIDAGPDDRDGILEAAKAEATYRPQVRGRRARSGYA